MLGAFLLRLFTPVRAFVRIRVKRRTKIILTTAAGDSVTFDTTTTTTVSGPLAVAARPMVADPNAALIDCGHCSRAILLGETFCVKPPKDSTTISADAFLFLGEEPDKQPEQFVLVCYDEACWHPLNDAVAVGKIAGVREPIIVNTWGRLQLRMLSQVALEAPKAPTEALS
jgi:hypothetical protein